MGNHDTSKVIPLFPQSHSGPPGAMSAYAPSAGDPLRETIYDHQLAHRRGFETVESVPPVARRDGATAGDPVPTTEARGNTMTASRLSAVFIESLDDMIRQMPGRQVAEPWPANPAATLNKVAADIVDMLFGFILDEQIVPRGVKEALLRAQLPVLQLAMRDTTFFADWQHPARTLLNELVPDLRTYIEHGGYATAFEQRFIAELDRVLDELTPNAAAFAELHSRIATFIHGTPAPDTSDDAQAWERAQAIARDFLERPLPGLARDFLAGYWVDVLQKTALAHATGSPQWQDAVAVVEDLAWSLAPKAAEEDRLHLIGLIPALLARLNRGLDLIDLPREDRRPFFDALIEIHATVLRAELTPPPPAPRHESAIEQVMRLHRGDWVEFTSADGSCRRERLTWISPQRGILVFSNHHGQGAIQISPEDLAERVAGHEAMLIFDQPATDTSRDTA